jgi:pimeloyl-ACP methyl ester carboxylesterase/predicted glycosyltransferase
MRARQPDQTGFVERGGVKLYYEIYGSGAQTMVFLPPWSIVHSRIYKAQLPWFAGRFRCITYDGRGNGRSERPADAAAYSLDHFVADALAVMDETEAGAAILVGLSFGGLLASILAAHHPDRVKAAILAGTSTTVGPPKYAYMSPQHFVARRERFEGWDKFNRNYWLTNYPDFAEHFVRNIFSEPHSTKQIEDAIGWANETTGAVLAKTVEARVIPPSFDVGEAMYRKIRCPLLIIHGDDDRIQPHARAKAVADITGAEFVTIPGGGHNVLGRFPAKANTLIADFLDRRLGIAAPKRRSAARHAKRALYLSSPIGLGHGRRDLAIVRELRKLHPALQVDWLAQDPVTRLLDTNGERIHPLSARLVSETRHIEMESGEHDLHAFEAIRRMDEVLIANFMIFQQTVEEGGYDLVIADESWDVDHYWHEHPELKKARLAWFTDFVGFVPMPAGGEREAFLASDYNAEMIEHVERHPGVRDRAIFVGDPEDIIPHSFGTGLPAMREWIPKHFDFAGYIIGEHPQTFGPREELRRALGYRPDERVCIVTVGGSGVGIHLIKRILQSYALVRAKLPELRMIVVTGPRIDPRTLAAPAGVELRAFVPDLDRHLAACDLALVQGGLTTCMELTAAGTPFVYFPLRNHFEQNFHVAHRLDRYGAGTRMDFATATPDMIADAIIATSSAPRSGKPVDADGAARAARMLAELV